MIPFLVVDRPASLRIIKGGDTDGKIGLMSHANTTSLFRRLFRDYPCGENPCHAIDPLGSKDCGFNFDHSRCNVAQQIRNRTVKMCDCGMFTKEGVKFSYPELFEIYDAMGADYGIMLDVFRDKDATLVSATEAMEHYRRKDYAFKLVMVAQGDTLKDYLSCYQSLLTLGGQFIAVGGLLQRVANTVRYVQVRDDEFMYQVLAGIREKFDPTWLFALGCYHPKRHERFEELGVWGSDYKGWIFQYAKRERVIQRIWEEISLDFSSVAPVEGATIRLGSLIKQRAELVTILENSEHKTSKRNIPLGKRMGEIIEIDQAIRQQVEEMLNAGISLNGTSRFLKTQLQQITNLSAKTEKQIRYEQVRQVVSRLGRMDDKSA